MTEVIKKATGFTSVVLEGVSRPVEMISFKDIRSEDEIIHVFADTENEKWNATYGEWLPTFTLWVGLADEYLPTSNEWWSDERSEYSFNGADVWELVGRSSDNNGFGWRIAADWHDSRTEGHALYRLI